MSLLLGAILMLVVSGMLALVASRYSRISTIVGTGGAVTGCVLALVPAVTCLVRGTTETFSRSWDVPYGSFTVGLSPLSAWFLLAIAGLSGLSAIYGAQYMEPYRERKLLGVPWFFYNLLVASMMLVVVARNGVLFLVAWEVMSLASYFLVTFEDEEASVRAAGRTYLIATHLGTAFLLAFFVLLGRQAGSLDFAAIAAAAPPQPALASLLFVLAVIGFGTKAGFIPLHVWLPEAHPAAPSHVSAVMSGVMVKTGIYGLVLALTFLPTPFVWWGWLLVGIGIVSGIWGVLFAIAQHDLKRLLAYHTVENIGIIALGLGLGVLGMSFRAPALAVLGFTGALLHVLNHALFKGLLFLGAGTVVHATGTRDVDLLGGLARRMPATALAFIIGSIAIVGLPPLNGFASEFLIYLGALRAAAMLGPASSVPGLLVIGALAMIGGLAAVCFTKVVGIVFLGEPRTEAAARAHAPGILMVVPMLVLALGCVLVGLLAPVIIRAVLPVAVEVAHLPADTGPALADAATVPLASVVTMAVAFLLLALGLVLVRQLLLRGRSVRTTVTWDCGYARPTPRMQYTASSYVQPTTALFGALLYSHTKQTAPSGPFPRAAAFHSETPDVCEDALYRPAFEAVGRATGRFRWLQQGSIHLYISYIALTLIILLIWFVSAPHGL